MQLCVFGGFNRRNSPIFHSHNNNKKTHNYYKQNNYYIHNIYLHKKIHIEF